MTVFYYFKINGYLATPICNGISKAVHLSFLGSA